MTAIVKKLDQKMPKWNLGRSRHVEQEVLDMLDARIATYDSGQDKGMPASKVFAAARKRLGLPVR